MASHVPAEASATVAEAARAAQVSRQTIYRRVCSGALFAHRLDLARIRLPGPVEPPHDWRDTAAFLEHAFPERWALPDPLGIDEAGAAAERLAEEGR